MSSTRTYRSCDPCRYKKVRCNVDLTTNKPCSNCSQPSKCIFTNRSSKTYIESLEKRLEALNQILRTVSSEFKKPPPETDFRIKEEEEDQDFLILEQDFASMSLSGESGYHGKSSNNMLVQTAVSMKYSNSCKDSKYMHTGRTFFRLAYPWQPSSVPIPKGKNYNFPPPDLMPVLIGLYFNHYNTIMPLLHKPSFEESVLGGLHLRDEKFGALVLVVCALGSRHSKDPRALSDGVTSPISNGWKWFNQISLLNDSWFIRASLYDLQLVCLAVTFLQAGPAPQFCWSMIAIALRLAQDAGFHRRRHQQERTIEAELWRRVWWVLIVHDRIQAAAMGRTCAITNDDFDVDSPIECDDDYWGLGFTQPADQPSIVCFFVAFNDLMNIQIKILRSLYSTPSSKKAMMGLTGPDYENFIVSHFEKSLENWQVGLPEHLRWDPKRGDAVFFTQSAVLHVTYQHAKLLLYRSFIRPVSKVNRLSSNALQSCVKAAQTTVQIIRTANERKLAPLPLSVMPLSAAAMILLIDLWDAQTQGRTIARDQHGENIEMCIVTLKDTEKHFIEAGKMADIIDVLRAPDSLFEALAHSHWATYLNYELSVVNPPPPPPPLSTELARRFKDIVEYSTSFFNEKFSTQVLVDSMYISSWDRRTKSYGWQHCSDLWGRYFLLAKKKGLL